MKTIYNGSEISEKDSIHFITTAEHPGDYLVAILFVAFTFIAVIGLIGIISKIVSEKANRIFCSEDYISQAFMFIFIMLAVVSVCLNGISQELFLGYTPRGEGFISIIAYFMIFFVASLIGKEKIKYHI